MTAGAVIHTESTFKQCPPLDFECQIQGLLQLFSMTIEGLTAHLQYAI